MDQNNSKLLKLYRSRVRKLIGAPLDILLQLPQRVLYQYAAYILLDKRDDLVLEFSKDMTLSMVLIAAANLYGKDSEEYKFLLHTELGDSLKQLERVVDEKRLLAARDKIKGEN